MPFPCQKGGVGAEMRVLVRISPILLFPDRFRIKPYPSKQKKGGEIFPLKDLVRGPVCWAKMVNFWKPWKHASWPPSECQEPFSMLPRHALSSFMVLNAGVGPWWAVTAEIFKGYGFKFHCLPTPFDQVGSPNHAPCAPCIESSFSRPKLSDSWTIAPAPRTPLIMLQILCQIIVVGEASHGANF